MLALLTLSLSLTQAFTGSLPVGASLLPLSTTTVSTVPVTTVVTSTPVVTTSPIVTTSSPPSDRSFLFNNPSLDLLTVAALSSSSNKKPTPSSSNLLPLLLLSGSLGNGGNSLFGQPYYDQYGNYQDPTKKAILLSGLASGSVNPLTAVALDRNPGTTTKDALVASALGNNPLTNLLVLNQPYGTSLTGSNYGNGGLFGNTFGNGGLFGNSYSNNGGLFGNSYGNNNNLATLAVASAVGGGSGLGTLLAVNALDNNNRPSPTYYVPGTCVNGVCSQGYYASAGYGNSGSLLGNIGQNLNNIFG